jgi:hypothetical protein
MNYNLTLNPSPMGEGLFLFDPTTTDAVRPDFTKNERGKDKVVGMICQENGFKMILKWFGNGF